MHGSSIGKVSVICILGTVASVGIFYAVYRILQSRNKEPRPPTKWRAVGKLKSLYMYPLKSGHRYEIRDSNCTKSGLYKNLDRFDWKDRCFIVYDPDTMEFKTAKHYPALVLVNIKPLAPGKLNLNTPDSKEVEIDLPTLDPRNKRKLLINKTDFVDFWDCGAAAAEFISMAILKSYYGLRIGYRAERFEADAERAKNGDSLNTVQKEQTGVCSDLSEYHLVSKTSVDRLNRELEQPVTEHYFRPNLYVYGHHIKAWEEESWQWIKIGSAIFRNLSPCVRCGASTIDPQTGERNKNEEPLRTLEKVALLKKKKTDHSDTGLPVMGIHLELQVEGKVHVHDQVYIA